ncbi:MAG: pentapeptide repeat-containing protein [Prosthecobacter sp.]|nr:pentapeptide repeat-containing protein [Prosthecobacter sp.]
MVGKKNDKTLQLHLSDANLSDANLSDANLFDANLFDANLFDGPTSCPSTAAQKRFARLKPSSGRSLTT